MEPDGAAGQGEEQHTQEQEDQRPGEGDDAGFSQDHLAALVAPAEEVEQGAGRQDQQDGQDNDGEDEIGQVESHEEDSFLCKVSLTLVG